MQGGCLWWYIILTKLLPEATACVEYPVDGVEVVADVRLPDPGVFETDVDCLLDGVDNDETFPALGAGDNCVEHPLDSVEADEIMLLVTGAATGAYIQLKDNDQWYIWH